MGNASGPSRISPCSVDPAEDIENDEEEDEDEENAPITFPDMDTVRQGTLPVVNTNLDGLDDTKKDLRSGVRDDSPSVTPPALGVVRSHPTAPTTIYEKLNMGRDERVLSQPSSGMKSKLGPPVRAVSWSNNDIQKKSLRLSALGLKDQRLVKIAKSATNLVYDLDTIRASITSSNRTLALGVLSNPFDSGRSSSQDTGTPASIFSDPNSSRVFRNSVLSPPIAAETDDEEVKKFIKAFFPLVDSKLPPACLLTLFTLAYDVFELASLPAPFCKHPLVCTSVLVLHRLGSVKRLKMKWPTIVKFLLKIEEQYKEVPYHSKWHAADVVATMSFFLCRGWFKDALTPEQQLTAVLAAASHDVAHDGTNNAYHVAAKTQIGVGYPESVLEYHHVATATGIRSLEGCDWTEGISHYDGAWTLFTALILRTDPALHPPGERKPFTDLANSTEKEREEAGTKLLPLIELLHLADISNACKPTTVARKWSESYYKEYLKIAKLVREKDLNIPMFKKGQKLQTLPGTQIGFINYVCLPSFKDLIVFLPEAKACVENLEKNLTYWMAKKGELERPGGGRKSLEKDEKKFVDETNRTRDDTIKTLSNGSSLEILVETQSQVEAEHKLDSPDVIVAKRLSSNDCSPPPAFASSADSNGNTIAAEGLRASKLLDQVEIDQRTRQPSRDKLIEPSKV